MSAVSDDEIVVRTGPKPATTAPASTAAPTQVPIKTTGDAASDPASNPKYKSWRKKFRKMKVHFDEKMKFNSLMFKEEQRLEALARRLRESNDHLLDLLLDLNCSLVIPPEDRFNIKWRESWTDRDRVDMESANKILAEAQELSRAGRYAPARFHEVKTDLEFHLATIGAKPLYELEEAVPQLPYKPKEATFERKMVDMADPIAYLTQDNMEDSLRRLDAELGEPPQLPSHDKEIDSPTPFSSMTAREVERETELRNPQSVHNWLKRHSINVTEVDDKSEQTNSTKKPISRNLAKKVGDRSVELAMERDGASPIGSTAGNRNGSENGDDDSRDDASSKRRRSRDADETYRPKGGKGGKPKRKREDGEAKGNSKKPKTSLSGMSDI